jgi:hypothetical protein
MPSSLLGVGLGQGITPAELDKNSHFLAESWIPYTPETG